MYRFTDNPIPTIAMTEHQPVLRDEVVDALLQAPTVETGRVYLDGTFGGGGHSRALLQADADCRVIALDRDPAAQDRAAEIVETFGERFQFIQANFADSGSLSLPQLSGALLDLGVSSFQLDTAERGFSFRAEAETDMRMDPEAGQSAGDFLETASPHELIRAIRLLGEEPQWKRVVSAILEARGTGRLRDTARLGNLIAEAVGCGRAQRGRIHPATRAFQGIRMAVNKELENLEAALPALWDALRDGGILAIISFHSLEDRIVKRAFRQWAGQPLDRRDHRPQQMRSREGELLSRRPLTPSDTELAINPRARSAKLRVIRKGAAV